MSYIDFKGLIEQIDHIIEYLNDMELQFADAIEQVDIKYQLSARNLIHYMAFRHFDIRKLQDKLASLGLSSLGRAEGHVLPTLLAVRKTLLGMSDGEGPDLTEEVQAFKKGKKSLKANTKRLFGRSRGKRLIPIMVTLPPETAHNYQMIEDLILAGMDVARINCAHDDMAIWTKMIEHINMANKQLGKKCKIAMDLAGPKVRSGPLKSRPKVVHVKPRRNHLGQVEEAGQIKLVPEDKLSLNALALPVDKKWIDQIEKGDYLHLEDTRNKKRKFEVIDLSDGITLATKKSAYITTGTLMKLVDANGNNKGTLEISSLPLVEDPIILKTGDLLKLSKIPEPGSSAILKSDGQVITPARISCTLPEVFKDVQPGAHVLLDDGKISAEVLSTTDDCLELMITRAKDNGSKLRGDKGINFPDSYLSIRGFTEKDKKDLQFVAQHADVVSMSFVKDPADVTDLQQALSTYEKKTLGIILKIETSQGFDHLPLILLTAMKHYPVGVMIARGDLAIECGWERLAEIQEEILWLCEAAQVPVIWATQVLEGKTKLGLPSRAEITDAAMAQRADCVMLGKGSHINEAITMLDNIISRMQEHQDKKTPMLRKLGVSEIEPAL